MTKTIKILNRMSRQGMTFAGLTEKATGWSETTICLQVNNVRPMELRLAEAIAEALGIPDSEFGDYFF